MNIRKFASIICMVLVVCLVSLLGVYTARIIIDNNSEQINAGTTKAVGGRINILLMVTDKSGYNTDTIMLVCYNKKTEKINVLSIPRDTRVQYGNKHGKINAAYAMGEKGKKQEYAISKITEITGLDINYYAVIDPKAFRNIIDILGGVEIDVPMRMYYADPYQDLLIDLYPGKQVLDGAKAEQFCRYRAGYAQADIARIDAQQMFIEELFKQKLNAKYLGKIDEIFDEVSANVNTNISVTDIFSFTPILNAMNGSSLQTYTLPGVPQTIGNASYYICNREETDKLINDVFLSNKSEEPTTNE